jgi:hypothetical protein
MRLLYGIWKTEQGEAFPQDILEGREAGMTQLRY